MRKLYLLFAVAALLAACSGEKTNQTEFTLNGQLENDKYEGKEIYLMKLDDSSNELVPIDTARIVNNSFSFQESVQDSAQMRFLSGEMFPRNIFFVAESGNISLSADSAFSVTLSGTELNNKYQDYLSKRKSYNDQMSEIKKQATNAKQENKFTPELKKELDDKSEKLYNESKDYIFNFSKENINNPVGQYVLIDRYKAFDKNQLEEIFSQLNESKSNEKKFDEPKKRLDILKRTDVGNTFTDIKGKTPDGKELALSDIAGKGKYVLVDFWASWCPPCREDMPEVVKLYNQYKSKGFEIVGVSLDTDNAAWQGAINKFKISWPQVSDLKGWQTELGGAYAVSSIPHMILLDKEGKIIANKISIPELSAKLAELL